MHTAAKERLSVATRQLKQAKDGFRPIQRKITEATDNVDAHKISTRDLVIVICVSYMRICIM